MQVMHELMRNQIRRQVSELGVKNPNLVLTNAQWGWQPNWVLTSIVPKWALANAQLGINFVPDMALEPLTILNI